MRGIMKRIFLLCPDINECASSPCQNGGTCVERAVNGYNCSCASGWAGEHCTTGSRINLYALTIIDITLYTTGWMITNSCTLALHPKLVELHIKPGITSISNFDFYKRNFHLLLSSSSDINECASNPCQNGGTCVDAVNGYSCSCVNGWAGEHCATGSRINLYALTIIDITLYTTGWMITNSCISETCRTKQNIYQ